MSTHVTRDQQDRLRDRTLTPAELAGIGRHAAVCDECRRSLQELVPVDRIARELRIQIEADDVEHLSDEQLMAYADDSLRGEELRAVRDHLQECEICAGELEELRRFKTLLPNRRPWKVLFAVAASLAVVVAAGLFLTRSNPPVRPVPAPVKSEASVPIPRAYERSTWNEWVEEVRRTRELPVPAILADLRGSRTQLRGSSEGALDLQPDHVVVASERPRFRWSGAGAGATYKVILKSGRSVVESESLTEPAWTPAAALKRGGEYEWQVEVTSGSDRRIYPRPPDPPARFRVLGQGEADEVRTAQERYPDDLLLHIAIMAHHGLRDEARAELDRLEQTDAPLAGSLRDSIRKWD